MEILIPNKEIETIVYFDETPTDNNEVVIKEDFKPVGAMAFFVLLIMLCMVVWFGIYFLMLQRN